MLYEQRNTQEVLGLVVGLPAMFSNTFCRRTGNVIACIQQICRRTLSISSSKNATFCCKLLVCGGGTGGCSIAAKFASKLGKGCCIVIEPSDKHYYQPMFTMIGGGMNTLKQSYRPMASVLPRNITWLKDCVTCFNPDKCMVVTSKGNEITYEYMVVALGLEMNYNAIEGLTRALSMPHSGVCSNYHPDYVERTMETLEEFECGNAIFTFPNSPVKCAGAPQKACYISEDYLCKCGKRENACVMYKTSLPVIFPVKRYAESLLEICRVRDIDVGLRQELIKIDPDQKEAVFRNLYKPDQVVTEKYEMLHVTPPMGAPAVLDTCKQLTDSNGFLNVDMCTLQHTEYDNIFGIGDCTNLPTAKTAAAVGSQLPVLFKNLSAHMRNKGEPRKYNGYSSCPLITGYGKCILAEYDYDLQPLETFPIDQSKERYSMFLLIKYLMPIFYWNLMLRGYWNGPSTLRTVLHLGSK